jgi:cytochrome bd-type quinol oxidase subunit 2
VSNTSNVIAPPLQLPRIPEVPVAYFTLALLFLLAVTLMLLTDFAHREPRRVVVSAMAVLVLGLVYASGCGSSRPTVKPPSNVTLTITAASASVSRTASLSLTVNH